MVAVACFPDGGQTPYTRVRSRIGWFALETRDTVSVPLVIPPLFTPSYFTRLRRLHPYVVRIVSEGFPTATHT